MDWTLCVICQLATTEVLRCPLNSPGPGGRSEPYTSFLDNVNAFRVLNKLPVPLPFEEDIDVNQLISRRAQWHKSCHTKFNATKLQRARKRERDDTTEISSADEKRHRHPQNLDKSICIFCRKPDGHVHEFRTLKSDDNVRSMATDLHDTDILSRIEDGDLIALDAKYHLACLTLLRNRHRSLMRQNQDSSDSQQERKIEASLC
jgi:hypothetical protein